MNCWILQCNINHYRWKDFVNEHKNARGTWGVRGRFLDEVEWGDIAFIWLTQYKRKETRGIYAMGKITGLPDPHREWFPYEAQYFTNEGAEERCRQMNTLELQYSTNTLFADRYISKDELERNGLGHLRILRRYRGISIDKVAKECETIKKLVEMRLKV